MLHMIFWPITDDEDVLDKEHDWECCCGTIHSLFGALLFVFADLIEIPAILSIYIKLLDNNESYTYYILIGVLSLATITMPSGPLAFIRLYLCLYAHVCSRMHRKIVVISMAVYFIRVLLFTLFAVGWAYHCLQNAIDGGHWLQALRQGAEFIIWVYIVLQYSIGTCLCYKALRFMKSRYMGIWDCLPQGILGADDSTFYDDIFTKKVDLAKNK